MLIYFTIIDQVRNYSILISVYIVLKSQRMFFFLVHLFLMSAAFESQKML